MYIFFLFVLLSGSRICLSDAKHSLALYPSSSSPSSTRPSSSRPSSSRPSSSRPSSSRPSSSVPSITAPSSSTPSSSTPSSSTPSSSVPSSSVPSSSVPSSSAPTRIVNLYYSSLRDTYANFTVPLGINSLDVKVYGAQGGKGNNPLFMNNGHIVQGVPGKGGYVNAILSVIPNQILYIFVGKQGGNSSSIESAGIGKGGFNGGGDGYNAGGGGGSSDIRTLPHIFSSRLIVAGGGGGASQQSDGGIGGSLNSKYGKGGGNQCGYGGTQSVGGIRGFTFYLKSDICPVENCIYNKDGQLFYGGSGGFQAQAGGGGGYYGGGGGGTWGGGGGGSNYVNTKKATLISQSAGVQSGDGLVIISYFL